MKKIAKKIVSFALSVAMLSGLLTVGASAADNKSRFADITDSACAEAAEALADAGIMLGVGDGKFAPNALTTRSMAITVLGRMAGIQETATDEFSDVPANTWYSGYVGWAAENEIVLGDGKGHFMPNEGITGQHMELMLTRYAKLVGIDYTAANESTDVLTRGELADMVYNVYTLMSSSVEKGTLYVEGYDWGPAVTKVIVTLNDAASSVSAEGAVVKTNFVERKVTNIFLSDDKGNAVQGESKYVTVELDKDAKVMSACNPFSSSNWVDSYVINTKFDVVQGGKTKMIFLNADCIDNRVAPEADRFTVRGIYSGTFTSPVTGKLDNISINYAAYEPASLKNDNAKNPLIIWMHGGGENFDLPGKGIESVLLANEASDLAGDDIQAYFTTEGGAGGAYVFVPQCETFWMDDGYGEKSWGDVPTRYTTALMNAIQRYVDQNGDIDPDRIYLGGCSNGGYMTVALMVDYPDYWAACYPVCAVSAYYKWERSEDGKYVQVPAADKVIPIPDYVPTDEVWMTSDKIDAIKDIPVWFVHAASDPIVVPTYTSMSVYRALVQAGAKNAWFSFFENALNSDLLPSSTPTFGHAVWQNFLNDQVKGVQNIQAIKDSADSDKTLGFTASDATGGGSASNGYDSIFAWMNAQVRSGSAVASDAAGTLYIEGYEWGPAVTKVIVTLPEAVNSVSKEGASISTKGVKRTIEKAYLSDSEGNEVKTASSKYVTLELDKTYANLSACSPFDNPTYFHNTWTPYYNVTAKFTVVQGGEKTEAALNANCINSRIVPDADQFTVRESYTGSDKEKVQYAATAPEALAKDNVKNPLIIWLHGAGEGGDGDPSTMEGELDIALLGNEAADLANPEIQKYFKTKGGADGAYVLVPQCETMWMDVGDGQQGDGTGISRYTKALMEAIDKYLASNPDVDTNRIYIGGCSNGGYMTVNMMIQYPDRWAAAYPVCEAYSYSIVTEANVKAIKDIPTWFVHCASDFVVNPKIMSMPLYRDMLKAGATNAWFSLYENVLGMDLDNEGVGFPHAIWQHVFNDAVKGVQNVEAIKNAAEGDETMGFVASDATNGGASTNNYDSIFAWMNAQVKK